eukprot:g1716.t1
MQQQQDDTFMQKGHIFFGHIKTRLKRTKGLSFRFVPDELIQLSKNVETVKAAQNRLRPQSKLGDSYHDVTIPAIPAVDIISKSTSNNRNWPSVLCTPLVKSPDDGNVLAYVSGTRSALVGVQDKENEMQRITFELYGRVQGVKMRRYIEAAARFLNIKGGFCCNTVEKTVYGEAYGQSSDVTNFIKWLEGKWLPRVETNIKPTPEGTAYPKHAEIKRVCVRNILFEEKDVTEGSRFSMVRDENESKHLVEKSKKSTVETVFNSNSNEATTRFFRLKGCGMPCGKGFTIRTQYNSILGQKCRDIRGSSHEHTTLRELHMTSKINILLQEKGMIGANEPFGWYQYTLSDDEKLPKIPRCCIVHETKGNRRLGTHLLAGLELLLPCILSGSTHSIESNLAEKFPPLEWGPRVKKISETKWEFTSTATLTEMGIATSELLLDASSHTLLPLSALDLANAPMLANITPSLHGIRNEQCLILENYLKNLKQFEDKEERDNELSLIGELYWRLGRDCGNILRILHENDISWGTYCDLNGPYHCNAHANNLVVLPPNIRKETNQFLAPLDFDMAYDRKSFAFDKKPNDFKGSDRWFDFDSLIKEEYAGFLMTISGSTVSTGVVQSTVESKKSEIIVGALRDTLSLGFINAYNGESDLHPASYPNNIEKDNAIYALIKLALLCTTSVIA